ncbi:MAG: hypothetical protein ONB37_04360 [candidate division KSB1 bacterium]|nr:hypothetical protein [candidate division KSB1 bacterium]
MTTSSLAMLKKNFGIDDQVTVKYEKRDNELILHVPLRSHYHSNDEIITQARNLVKDKKESGWSRQNFFADFMQVREKVLEQIREHYEQN